MAPVLAIMAGLTIYAGGTADTVVLPASTCTSALNSAVVSQLGGDSTLPDVISYLRRTSVSFDVFSSTEQRIQESQLDSLTYEQEQPIKLIVAAPDVQRTELVKETELLIMMFGKGKHITSFSCETFYTGP